MNNKSKKTPLIKEGISSKIENIINSIFDSIKKKRADRIVNELERSDPKLAKDIKDVKTSVENLIERLKEKNI